MNAAERLLEEDRAGRERALEPASFIVEAPAGAGKTELLSQRYLRLLASVDEPEEIVAITFTNKAAAEMKGRILDSLGAAAAGDRPQAAHKRVTYDLARAALDAATPRGWQLGQTPARLSILTIDALCAGIARQMPLLSRFGAQPRISDDSERHYREAARRTLAMLDGDDPVAAAVVAAALRHLDNDASRAATLLSAMLARRDQWLSHTLSGRPREEAEQGLAALVVRDLEQAARHLPASVQVGLMAAARYAAAHLPAATAIAALNDWQEPLSASLETLPIWRGLIDLLLTREGDWRKQFTKNLGLPPNKDADVHKQALRQAIAELAGRPEATSALARIRRLPEPRYSDEEWQIVDALGNLLKHGAAALWTVFHEAGEADFVEVAQRALQALGGADDPTDLALALDYRIKHLLVDEFQDTSPTQVRLLERLTAGWQPGDGRTLFAVGDPMQSIYRFRKADVGLFIRLAAASSNNAGSTPAGIGSIVLERLRLCRNNRSSPALVDWVNAGFARAFPTEDSAVAGAIGYRLAVATHVELPGAGVRVHPLVLPQGFANDAADRLEAQCILDIIADARASGPKPQIAVLVRARSHLAALVAEIRRHRPELRFNALEIDRLGERQSVQDILSLTRALLHRADRVSWLAVLRAPWCGLTLTDLHALAGDDHQSSVWRLINDAARAARLSADGRLRLAHLRAVIGEALAQQGRMPLRRWVEGTWLGLGGAACLRNSADVADAGACLAMIETLDVSGRFRLDRLEDEAASLYATPDAGADGALEFMTIHKAKGLEFDTVIVPGLHKKPGNDAQELMLWEEVALEGLTERLVAAPLLARGERSLPTSYEYLRLFEQERSANEAARVLYVAATRAVRRLHLLGAVRCDAKGEFAPAAGSLLELIWDAVGADFAAVAPVAPEPTGKPERFVPKLLRVAAPVVTAWQQPSEPASGVPPSPQIPGVEDDDEPLDASVGTLVHAYLELIAREGLAAWPVARVDALAAAMRLWLARRGHAAGDAEAGAARVGACLKATLESRVGRWVLDRHDDDAMELMLAAAGGAAGRITTHVVDRSFIDDGSRWIIDYKTARVTGDAPALAAHAERYRPQLERYAALFAGEGLPLRLAVFYADHGRLIELPAMVS